MTDPRAEGAESVGPWFRQHPGLAVGLAAGLFAAVLVLRWSAGGAEHGYSMLYVFPVALLAVVFGLRGGIAGGVVAVGLLEVWVLADGVSLTATGWMSRVLPLMLLGLLLGSATDRLRRAEAQRVHLAEAALLHRKAIEINDSLVQGMVAAKWSLESGRLDDGVRTLDDTIGRAQDLVSGLIREAEMGDRTDPVG